MVRTCSGLVSSFVCLLIILIGFQLDSFFSFLVFFLADLFFFFLSSTLEQTTEELGQGKCSVVATGQHESVRQLSYGQGISR